MIKIFTGKADWAMISFAIPFVILNLHFSFSGLSVHQHEEEEVGFANQGRCCSAILDVYLQPHPWPRSEDGPLWECSVLESRGANMPALISSGRG